VKKFALRLIFLLCTNCASKAPSLKAVYFVHGQGELSSDELKAHPEVIVVQTFEELKKNSSQKIALWIDKSATPFDYEQEIWINTAPQVYYPIALIGAGDTSHAFRDLLKLRCFSVRWGDSPDADAPGFSIVQREPPAGPTTAPMDVTFVHGYNQKSTVKSILEITNDLLEGKVRPTPISTLPKPIEQIATSAIRQVVLYDEWPCTGFPNNAAKINAVMLEQNTLKINVAYQGGCKEHTFALYAATAFLQSNQGQGILDLSHDAHGDTCTEKVEKLLSFDLTPLNEERNDPSERPLLLRIYEPIGGSFAMEPFMPLIEWP